jgi:hypothetical protein
MSTTAIACELLVLNTAGADMPDAGGGVGNGIVATTPADGWVISPPTNETFGNGRLFLRLTVDGSGDTFVFLGGDRYPAQRADLGNMSIVLAASDSRMIVIETSRFLQNDGTILVTCADTGSVISASMLPRAG